MTRIRFEDLPSTNTPRNAENLNKLNNVVISPTEPTTGEEVWMQRSGNIFDKNNYGLFKGYMSSVKINFIANNSGYLVYIPCIPNTDYIVTREVLENNFQVGSGNIVPVNNGQVTQVILAETSSKVTIKTGANDTYLYIYVKYDGNSSYTLEQILDSLRVEISKKIYTKNDNGVYEEFYDENLFLKDNNLVSQRTNNVGSSWQTIPFNNGHKNMIFIINGSDYQDIKNIPIALIKKFQPPSPLKIKINGNIIIQLAWNDGNIVEYIWGGNYTVDHYTY